MIVGMDFGTTNSGVAVYDGRDLRRLPLDPSNENARILRTALYITNEQNVFVGREAIDRYFDHNVGRPVKLEKVWVGEIEVMADLVYFIQDAYVWTDVMSPGRLLLSFKSNLRDREYTGTVIGHFFYPIESLVSAYLYTFKLRAEKLLGQELDEVVLGRPVRFADDAEADNLAQERLLRSAFQAGYKRVYLQREPVAAAYHYASTQDEPQKILVFDFGGGTLDITVMRLGNGVREVLATGGVPVAGDVFDQKLVRARLPKHFGEGSRYGPKEMPIPRWIYDTFSNWQTILELQTPDNVRILEQIEQTAQRPREIRALINLVSGNYGLQMFDAVEQTKRDLSERFGGMIRLDGPGFDVLELVTRREFENVIRPEYLRIERHLEETVQASGLKPEQVDAVIRTGGSAEIPLFQQMLRRKFGPDSVHSVDTFGSVTAGLGIIAHGIQRGDLDVRAYTRQDLKQQDVTVKRPNVAILDSRLLRRRIRVQEETGTGEAGEETVVLVILTEDNELLIQRYKDARHEMEAMEGERLFTHICLAGLDEPLLLITSRYRFLVVSPRELMDLKALGQTLAELHQFGPYEKVYAVHGWRPLKEADRLVLVTSVGYARAYPTNVIAPSIEAPVPLTFEQPLPGWPLAALGAQGDKEELVLVTDNGRGARFLVEDVPGTGARALKRKDEERLVGSVLAAARDELLLVTAQGYARRLPLAAVYAPAKENSRGRVLIARGPVRDLVRLRPAAALWAMTTAGLKRVKAKAIPLEADTTRSHRLLELAPDETLLRTLSLPKFLGNSNSNGVDGMLE